MLDIHPIILQLLNQRGISREEDLTEFLSDKPQKTYDPFLLLNLEAGVDLLLSAMSNHEKICIYGDYDADGVTAVSILMEFMGNLTGDLEYYIPSRFDEGYGLNREAVGKIKSGGARVLLTVDCGSTSYEEVEYAKASGLQVIVTDHHSITDRKADCLLINPKQQECAYPFKGLAGCGVAFKLAQGLQKKSGLPRSALNQTLDLVAIGTIGDVVPLTDENRTLVKHGMHVLNAAVRPGLKNLIESASMETGKVRPEQVAFGIVPHLNAAGRMKDARVAVELLTSQNKDRIHDATAKLLRYNRERKEMQEQAYKTCLTLMDPTQKDNNFLVIYTEDIHEGIAGIVAGKLKDTCQKPVIIVTPSADGLLKGTGRSVEPVNLYEALKAHEALFQRFGGHEGACGFTIKQENLGLLISGLEADGNQKQNESGAPAPLQAEAGWALQGNEITVGFAEELEKLAPFGNQNPKPVFTLRQTIIAGPQAMGSNGDHVRFRAKCRDGSSVNCVLFQRAKDYEALVYGETYVDLAGTIELQEWKGNKKVQFIIVDMV